MSIPARSILAAFLLAILTIPVFAFSETPDVTDPPSFEVPLPDPLRPGTPGNAPEEAAPEIFYDSSTLPEPVARMRERIMEACRAGDIEALRAFLSTGTNATQLSLAGMDGDPIEFLRTLSGDEEGHEILAILYEVLDAGYVHLDVGTPQELYVWPYFVAMPIAELTPPQRVELFKLVTAGDYEEMKAYGTYVFFRVGITPQGEWEFFVGGE
ncbi:hypothetical protein [Aliihoeflea sp. PC F10.4]